MSTTGFISKAIGPRARRTLLSTCAVAGALVAAFPRYHPRWAWWLTSVPVLREFLVSNLVLVLRP